MEVSASSLATRVYWFYWKMIFLEDGVLYRQFEHRDGSGSHIQVITPESLRKEVPQLSHGNRLSGHLGMRRTRERVIQNFYWFEVRSDCDLYVTACDICQSIKRPTKTPKACLGEMPVGGPLDRLLIDILGPLPLSKKGNRYIMVSIDQFTKWVEILALPDQKAHTCADALLNEVIARYGCPLTIHTDQGRNFESKLFIEVCVMLEICKTRTTAGHPQCNGLVECMNHTLICMIKSFLRGEEDQWDKHLGCLVGAYQSTRHSSTGLTPNKLMLG